VTLGLLYDTHARARRHGTRSVRFSFGQNFVCVFLYVCVVVCCVLCVVCVVCGTRGRARKQKTHLQSNPCWNQSQNQAGTQTHSTQYTAHSTQHTAHSTQHTAHSTQHTAHSTQHTAHSTQHTVHSTQHTAHSTDRRQRDPLLSICRSNI
jgi:uncharacterized membrane protein YcjF (UPF0283 family)